MRSWLLLLATVAPASAQNVLLVVSDDLSANALSAYGNSEVHTPNIDRLAQRGVVFDRAYCQYAVCAASRASFLTGLYPPTFSATGASFEDIEAAVGTDATLPEHFRRNGYRTERVSKVYHMLVPGDITAGVAGADHADSWDATVDVMAPEWRSVGTTGHFTNETLNFHPTAHYNLGFGAAFYTVATPTSGAEQADWIAADAAVQRLQSFAAPGAGPFFLAVGFVRPHVPLVAPAAEFARYDPQQLSLAASVPNDLADIRPAGVFWHEPARGPNSDNDRREVLRAYYASVTFMDAQLGRLLDALEQTGLDNDTIVVFTSDHGYHLGEHTFWQKLSLHEESARVPLLIAGPGIPAGRTAALAELVDLFPTLADLAGLSVPVTCQGMSLEPVLLGNATSVRDAAFSMVTNGWMLRTTQWAYLVYSNGAEELYDMRANGDPRQFTNLAGNPANAGLIAQFRMDLTARLASFTADPGDGFCYGDALSGFCPCFNFGNVGEGCMNSTGHGATLEGVGRPVLAADTFQLRISGAPPGNLGLLFQGASTTGAILGDGLLCASFDRRLQVTTIDGTGNAAFDQLASSAYLGGNTYYQFVFRDAGPCGTGLNVSNAWRTMWQ